MTSTAMRLPLTKWRSGTGIAVAFARSPMALAQVAWDIQRLSQGRFMLGLGTQVKAHIERRFGMARIDAEVRAAVASGAPLYALDEERIRALRPTHVISQGLCPVCGQSRNDKECGCDTHVVDPRLAALKDLKGIKL